MFTTYLALLKNQDVSKTRISDFHKMVITVMKVFYKKQELKIIQCRSYKNFDNEVFQRELNSELLKSPLFSKKAFHRECITLKESKYK